MTDEQFTPLAERYMDTVFRVAYSYLRCRDDADDVTQDVLIQLYKEDKAFESDAHVKNWLIRVTVNRCKNVLRAPWHKAEDIADYENSLTFEAPECRELFDAVDQKTAVPMIPEYQDYVLTELQKRNILRPLQVKSLSRRLEAWLLRCEEKDKNIVAVMEDGLKSGAISIPGATVGLNPLDEINSITEYLKTFGVTVA